MPSVPPPEIDDAAVGDDLRVVPPSSRSIPTQLRRLPGFTTPRTTPPQSDSLPCIRLSRGVEAGVSEAEVGILIPSPQLRRQFYNG